MENLRNLIQNLNETSVYICLADDDELRDVVETTSKIMEQAAEELNKAITIIGELYISARNNQNVNQYNPYQWCELNAELFHRLKPYINPIHEEHKEGKS